MRIEYLTARCFRNLLNVNIHITSDWVVLYGSNAQGKSNLLEALYLCATGRSFRSATSCDMLGHGSSYGMASMTWACRGVRHEVSVRLSPRQRFIRLDGRALQKITHLFDMINIVAFFPDDLKIVKGSPEERRRFLDRAVANSQPQFVQASLAYHRALKSRNALLRSPHPPDRDVLTAYDAPLVQFGSMMHSFRQKVLEQIQPVAQHYFSCMLPKAGCLTLHLQSGLPESKSSLQELKQETPQQESIAAWGASLQAALAAGYARDRARGMTLVGPHRADVHFNIQGQAARTYASQGQQRALVLALKLAEVTCLTQTLGASPILLLDDVSSELDTECTRLLFDVIKDLSSHVWLSSTGAVSLPIPQGAYVLKVQNGMVEPF